MKTIYLAFFQLLFVPFAAAQGTLQFHSTFSYLSDPSIQVGSGEFSLDRNLFWGASFFEPPNQFTSIRIEDATRSTVFETREIIDSAPLTFLKAKWNQVELTSSQVDSLIRGDWQVTIASVDFPEGEIVGRIELVPEPRPWLLFGLGFLLVAQFAHRNAVGSPARAGFNRNLPGR